MQTKTHNQIAVNHTLVSVICINVFPLLGFETLKCISHHKRKEFLSLKGTESLRMLMMVEEVFQGQRSHIIVIMLPSLRVALRLLQSFLWYLGMGAGRLQFLFSVISGPGWKLRADLPAGASGSGELALLRGSWDLKPALPEQERSPPSFVIPGF